MSSSTDSAVAVRARQPSTELRELVARKLTRNLPACRFEGQAGEQWTMFFKDPSGNNLEFKR